MGIVTLMALGMNVMLQTYMCIILNKRRKQIKEQVKEFYLLEKKVNDLEVKVQSQQKEIERYGINFR